MNLENILSILLIYITYILIIRTRIIKRRITHTRTVMQEFTQISIQFIEQQLNRINWEDAISKLKDIYFFKFDLQKLINSTMLSLIKLFYKLAMKIVIFKAYGHLVVYDHNYFTATNYDKYRQNRIKQKQIDKSKIDNEIVEASKGIKSVYCKILSKIKQKKKIEIMDILILIFCLLSRNVLENFFNVSKKKFNNSSYLFKTNNNLATSPHINTGNVIKKQKPLIKKTKSKNPTYPQLPSYINTKVKFDTESDNVDTMNSKSIFKSQNNKSTADTTHTNSKQQNILTIEQYAFIVITHETTGNLINPNSFNFLKKKYTNPESNQNNLHSESRKLESQQKQKNRQKTRQRQRKSIIVESLKYIKDEIGKTQKYIDFGKQKYTQKQILEKQNKQLQDHLRSALRVFEDYDHYQIKIDRKQDIVSKNLNQLLEQIRKSQSNSSIQINKDKLSKFKSLSYSNSFQSLNQSSNKQMMGQNEDKTHEKHRSFTKLQKITQKSLSKAVKYYYRIKQRDLSLLERNKQKQQLLQKNTKVKYWRKIKSITKPIFYIKTKSVNQNCYIQHKNHITDWNQVIQQMKRKVSKEGIQIQKFKVNSMTGNTGRSQKQNSKGYSQKEYIKFCQKKQANEMKNKSESCYVSFNKKANEQKKKKDLQLQNDKQITERKIIKQDQSSQKQKPLIKSMQKTASNGQLIPKVSETLRKKYECISEVRTIQSDACRDQFQVENHIDLNKIKKKTRNMKLQKKQFEFKCKQRKNFIDGLESIKQE